MFIKYLNVPSTPTNLDDEQWSLLTHNISQSIHPKNRVFTPYQKSVNILKEKIRRAIQICGSDVERLCKQFAPSLDVEPEYIHTIGMHLKPHTILALIDENAKIVKELDIITAPYNNTIYVNTGLSKANSERLEEIFSQVETILLHSFPDNPLSPTAYPKLYSYSTTNKDYTKKEAYSKNSHLTQKWIDSAAAFYNTYQNPSMTINRTIPKPANPTFDNPDLQESYNTLVAAQAVLKNLLQYNINITPEESHQIDAIQRTHIPDAIHHYYQLSHIAPEALPPYESQLKTIFITATTQIDNIVKKHKKETIQNAESYLKITNALLNTPITV